MALLETTFADEFANNPQNYLQDFLRRPFAGSVGGVAPPFGEDGRLLGFDRYTVTERMDSTTGRLMFDLFSIEDGTAPDDGIIGATA
jgi:hypothetical protein